MANWFKRRELPPTLPATKPELPTAPVEYPTGIAVKTQDGKFYFLHKDGKRYRIQSSKIFMSWGFPLIVPTTEAALKNYPVAVTKLGFRDGSLLNNIADGKLYLVSESRLRHITNPEVLTRLGVTREDALVVSDADIKIMKLGEEII